MILCIEKLPKVSLSRLLEPMLRGPLLSVMLERASFVFGELIIIDLGIILISADYLFDIYTFSKEGIS